MWNPQKPFEYKIFTCQNSAEFLFKNRFLYHICLGMMVPNELTTRDPDSQIPFLLVLIQLNPKVPEPIKSGSTVVQVFEDYLAPGPGHWFWFVDPWLTHYSVPSKETDEFQIWLTDKLRKLVISHDFYFQFYSWEDHLRSISSLEKDWYE